MVSYSFSHYEVNGMSYYENPLTIQVMGDTTVTAVYEAGVEPDPVVYSSGDYAVFQSLSIGDYYVKRVSQNVIMIRFPTAEEAIQWVLDNLPSISMGALALTAVAGIWLFTRKK